ncbi:hypothetical protein M8J76_002071 [Diaphorina citri]|nr:hypothetical protein M8J75_004483 [Diaphorina citri]KAI5729400.1 hypothetical protein M8J76_002071 [Diaphorina citri]
MIRLDKYHPAATGTQDIRTVNSTDQSAKEVDGVNSVQILIHLKLLEDLQPVPRHCKGRQSSVNLLTTTENTEDLTYASDSVKQWLLRADSTDVYVGGLDSRNLEQIQMKIKQTSPKGGL